MRILSKAFLCVAVGMALGLIGTVKAAEVGTSAASAANAGARCTKCHEEEVASFNRSYHAKVWAAKGSSVTCVSCHGENEAAHIKAEDKASIVAFSKGSAQSATEQNKQCLACHNSSRTTFYWNASHHAKNDVSCASCHSMHKSREAMKPTSQTCLACHKDIAAEVRKVSHHPILEGKVGCADCHNPHGSPSHGSLLGENLNQTCYKCHADKRGPFLWEHPPVEENCASCHTPHGSSHAKLLTEKVPLLCQSCHDAQGHPSPAYSGPRNGFNAAASSDNTKFLARSCLNCHSQIHGSMTPGGGTFGGQSFNH